VTDGRTGREAEKQIDRQTDRRQMTEKTSLMHSVAR